MSAASVSLSLLCVAAVLLLSPARGLAEDGYLTSSRDSCLGTGGLLDCGKYQLARLLHRAAATPRSFDMGPLRLVSVPQSNTSDTSAFSLLPREAASQSHLPEYMRMLQFGVRQLELFLKSHGLSLPLSMDGASGAKLMYDDGTGPATFTDRGVHSKKKMHLFLPMLVMLKFGIIKALLIPVLLGIVFIKKVIVLGVMVLPSILSMLKACKIVPPSFHHTPYHSEGFSAGGGDFASYASQADSYGKDWQGANQRRTRYGKSSLAYDQAEFGVTEQP